MIGAFFFICMFLITVGGLLLFRPVQIHSITDYSEPAALESRKKVTVKMAEFLEQNPQIVKQKRFTTLSPNIEEKKNPETSAVAAPSANFDKINLVFQGANIQFNSSAEVDQWIFSNVSQDPINFLKQFRAEDQPEFYLDTLKKVSEIKPTEDVLQHLKQIYLEEAKKMSLVSDGYHQQLMQKFLQNYLDLEKDKDLGKKTADEVLRSR